MQLYNQLNAPSALWLPAELWVLIVFYLGGYARDVILVSRLFYSAVLKMPKYYIIQNSITNIECKKELAALNGYYQGMFFFS